MTISAFILREVLGEDCRMVLTGEEQQELHARTLRMVALSEALLAPCPAVGRRWLWQWLGRTRGHGRQTPPKEVFVWPLVPDCRARLRDGDAATRTPRTPSPRLPTPGFLDLWGTLTDALATVCEDTDRCAGSGDGEFWIRG